MLGASVITVWSVGGVSLIQSWKNGTATLAVAVNVVAMFVYRSACCWATGAAAAEKLSRPWKNPARSVCLEDRFCATGPRSLTSGTNARIASLMAIPRPASVSP